MSRVIDAARAEPIDFALAAAIIAVHGVADSWVTWRVLVSTEDFTLESNPLLGHLLVWVFDHAAVSPLSPHMDAVLVLPFLAKMGVVTAMALAAWRFRGLVPLWRAWVVTVTVVGLFVVLSNATAL